MSMHFRGIMFLSIIGVAVPALAGVPNEIHHQGVIAVHGERFTGQGDFYFALVDELGYNLWTNDGTNIDPPSQDRPESPVTLTVVNGVYRVRLGHPPTVAIPRAVFNENDHVALRIWFDDGVNGVHQLSPDQLLTGVPYAQRLPNVLVNDAGNVSIGPPESGNALSVDGDADFSGHVGVGTPTPTASLQVSGGVRARGGPPGAVGANNRGYAFDGDGGDNDSGMFSTGNGQVEFYTNNQERMRIDPSGNVGIGIVTPQARLDVDGIIKGDTYAFRAHSSDEVPLNADSTIVSFDEVVDPLELYSDNSVFTAPATGHYFLTSSISFHGGDGADDSLRFHFFVNDSVRQNPLWIDPRWASRPGMEAVYTNSAVLLLQKDDGVIIRLDDVHYTSASMKTRTFSGFYLGK